MPRGRILPPGFGPAPPSAGHRPSGIAGRSADRRGAGFRIAVGKFAHSVSPVSIRDQRIRLRNTSLPASGATIANSRAVSVVGQAPNSPSHCCVSPNSRDGTTTVIFAQINWGFPSSVTCPKAGLAPQVPSASRFGETATAITS